jgi:hypothetical protein
MLSVPLSSSTQQFRKCENATHGDRCQDEEANPAEKDYRRVIKGKRLCHLRCHLSQLQSSRRLLSGTQETHACLYFYGNCFPLSWAKKTRELRKSPPSLPIVPQVPVVTRYSLAVRGGQAGEEPLSGLVGRSANERRAAERRPASRASTKVRRAQSARDAVFASRRGLAPTGKARGPGASQAG